MGDRCHLEVLMADNDREKFERLFQSITPSWGINDIWNESWVEDGVFTGYVYEANYGWEEELTELATAGCEFHGSNGPGGDYDATEFVTINNKLVYVGVDVNGNIVAPIDLTTFTAEPESISQIKLFIKGMSEIIDKFNTVLSEEDE